ncbi:hypothetical protein AC1031_008541 [Aphanomyces cochlioides]|nr:hypothetical protein AC1031_008541 [Aphanomyces cochlioides]
MHDFYAHYNLVMKCQDVQFGFLARVDGFDGYGDIVELGGDDTSAATTGNDTQASPGQDERELVLITDLPNYRVIASGGSTSIIATELDDIPVAIKTVDTCKKPELLNELHRECDAYAALKALQGDSIPVLVRPAPVVLWEGILDGLVLSYISGQTLEELGYDGIASIPDDCRWRAIEDLRKIHSMGVLHG